MLLMLLSVAVDMSVAQNSLLELKVAAIAHLDYHDYLLLIGEAFGHALDRYDFYLYSYHYVITQQLSLKIQLVSGASELTLRYSLKKY